MIFYVNKNELYREEYEWESCKGLEFFIQERQLISVIFIICLPWGDNILWIFWYSFFLCLQAVRATTGDLTAATGVSAKTGQSVTPSRGPVSALTGTRDGVVRSPVRAVTMARLVSCPVSVSMVEPASTWQESASVRRDTQAPCEYQHLVHSSVF